MKHYLVAILLLTTVCLYGQVNKQTIKAQAELTTKALMEDDYVTLLKFTHPKVIEMLGGQEVMISLIRKGKVEMEQQGIKIESATFGEASDPVKAGDEIHCLIPQIVTVKVPNGRMKNTAHLLAVSKNNGGHWYFLDTANLTAEQIKSFLPNYNSELKLPASSGPEFMKN